MNLQLLERLDGMRRQSNFLTVTELLSQEDNTFLDPFSTLIGRGVRLGAGNVFYPNVVVEQRGVGTVQIGDGNLFYSNTFILATSGAVMIGSHNQFGDGGCAVKLNGPSGELRIGNRGRYTSSAELVGNSTFGDGSQVVGRITVIGCHLGAGEDHTYPDADQRGAVLKGFGQARNLTLAQGQVVNGAGQFSDAPVEMQSKYHPKLSS